MVFEKTLRRELFAAASAVFITLLTIILTISLIRILGQAAAGKVGADFVLLLIGFTAINYVPMVLVLTLFISILLVISRMYRDSEMVVWFASGVSLTDFIRPIAWFVAPAVILIAAFGFLLSPWANQQISELRGRFEQRDDVSKLSAGQFIESGSTNRVFFVENFDENQRTVANVFAASREPNQYTIVVADSGRLEERDDRTRYMVLDNGYRYEAMPGSPKYSVMAFERYAIRIDPRQVSLQPPGAQTRTMTAEQLFTTDTPASRGELLWRISLPLFALNLSLLALPLSFLNPRAGRSANLLAAILLFFIYQSLINLVQAWVSNGRLPFVAGWWPVHVIVLCAALVLLIQRRSAVRLNGLSLRTWRVWFQRWRDRSTAVVNGSAS